MQACASQRFGGWELRSHCDSFAKINYFLVGKLTARIFIMYLYTCTGVWPGLITICNETKLP